MPVLSHHDVFVAKAPMAALAAPCLARSMDPAHLDPVYHGVDQVLAQLQTGSEKEESETQPHWPTITLALVAGLAALNGITPRWRDSFYTGHVKAHLHHGSSYQAALQHILLADRPDLATIKPRSPSTSMQPYQSQSHLQADSRTWGKAVAQQFLQHNQSSPSFLPTYLLRKARGYALANKPVPQDHDLFKPLLVLGGQGLKNRFPRSHERAHSLALAAIAMAYVLEEDLNIADQSTALSTAATRVFALLSGQERTQIALEFRNGQPPLLCSSWQNLALTLSEGTEKGIQLGDDIAQQVVSSCYPALQV